MSIVFEKPQALTDAVLHYCPGCTHGIIHRLVAEVMDELGITGRTIGVALLVAPFLPTTILTVIWFRRLTAVHLPLLPA